MEKKIQLPLDEETILSLHAGDTVLLSGSLITGRDAAHQRLIQTLDKAEALPIELKGEVIYYVDLHQQVPIIPLALQDRPPVIVWILLHPLCWMQV